MTVLVLAREVQRGPRPLDVLRDLDGITKLISLAFAEDMARDGSNVAHDLALLAMSSPFLWTLRRVSPEVRDAFDGFVWLEDGEIVGNVTLTRDDLSRRVWTVTNVAVNLQHRRRGIARTLMQMALGAVDERGGGPVVLEVRPDNAPAYDLYRQLGFRFVDGSVTLRSPGRSWIAPAASEGTRPVALGEWRHLYDLVQAVTSADAQTIRPLRLSDYQVSLADRLAERLAPLGIVDRRLWLAARSGDAFLAAAQVVVRRGGTAKLKLFARPEGRGAAEESAAAAALDACRSADAAVNAVLSEHLSAALRLMLQCGFTETRRLHRLVVDV